MCNYINKYDYVYIYIHNIYEYLCTNLTTCIQYIHPHLEASMSNIYTALLNKDPTHPLTPKNSSARQPQCLMEPHFAAPVPPDMPLMVKWSAFPFTTPGNEMLRQRFPVLVGCKVGRKCPCFTCPNLVPFASSQ